MPDSVKPEPIYQSSGHISMRLDGRPDVQFQFARQPKRTALAMLASFTVQAGILAMILFAGRFGLEQAGVLPERSNMVFIANQPGPGGGGGGGGNQMKEPPKKAEIPKPKPVAAPRIEPKPEPEVTPQFNIPVTTIAQVELPGAMLAPAALPTLSQGSGRGGGGGTGTGTGVGPGTGSGLGPGSGGGTGGGVYKGGGSGVTDPVPTYEAVPVYTGEAMRARIQGAVWVECTVTKAGVCTDTHVVRSLDSKYGLDQEAVTAARKWRFKPGLFQGQPVDVIVLIEIEFRLR